MIENSNFVTIPSFLTETDGFNKSIKSLVTFLNKPKSYQEFLFPNSSNEVIVREISSSEKLRVDKSIYVCTFCQVFSPSESAIVAHILSVHRTSLPCGTRAIDFVSQLQALQNENEKERKNKGGRPRKKSSSNVVQEKELDTEPVQGPDGLYQCQKCHRHFKKPRQLNRHVCHEITAENFSSESAADSDCTSDFQTFMDIEPTPWLRRPKHNNKSNVKKSKDFIQSPGDEILYDSGLSKSENARDKTKIYWRDDPNYVQLFENDAERYAFEEHLKSIDYSCVDSLFAKVQNKSKSFKKENKSSNITLYSCIICLKEFHSLSHIRMHCLTHTDVKPFTCPKCPYRSNTKGSLYTHMRNHTGKLFYCSKCSFKSNKRSHLLEHEETHSSIMQLCKLCKNTYKTVKSLIAHVLRYHSNPRGKKYVKFLSGKSSKDSFVKCDVCQKKFKNQTSFSTHTHTIVSTPTIVDDSHGSIQATSATIDYENIQNTSATIDHSEESFQNTPSCVVSEEPLSSMPDNNIEYTNEMQTLKDPLDEIVLNDLLQQKNSEIYQNVLQQSSNSHIQPESEDLSNAFIVDSASRELSQLDVDNQFQTSNTVLEECEKTLGIDLIKECLKDSNFADQVMAETCALSSKLSNDPESFGLHEIQMDYPNESAISPSIAGSANLGKNLSHIDSELKNDSADFVSAEPKSVETKLFERCHQTPAYVCCVCSAIYVCPATLKIHLKEHVNTSSSLIEQNNDDIMQAKLSEADATIDSVCKMLEELAVKK
ncbi:Zinc finger protein ZFAT like protein [Argiope bruennichi]|uniref:Zinc finger protein ZFAT like protein n=1 Tax=Argiope bruennichi TaxID=94029 RepID=A0A8T0EDX7_ARGBR|nr:Zinc finger protein ZFAT like protein [Argiope bruennichi]